MSSAVATTTGRRRRHLLVWIALGVLALAAGLTATAIESSTAWSERGLLDPDSSALQGAHALVQILREEGVEVIVARSSGDAAAAMEREPATLVLPDDPALSDDEFVALAEDADDTVMLEPTSRGVRLLLSDGRIAGYASADPLSPDCALDLARRAGPILAGALFTASDATACYPDGDGAALLTSQDASGTTSVVDGTVLFTNDALADGGNASLGIQLLGRNARVVWLVPDPLDTSGVGALTPTWTTPVLVLLALSAVAAAFWQGRRFGPLVRENLPVSVRADEVDAGRAQLYARVGDLAHVASALRRGALRRSARTLRLPPGTSAEVVADAVARVSGDRDARADLLGPAPATRRELVALHDRLTRLEQAVHAAGRPREESS